MKKNLNVEQYNTLVNDAIEGFLTLMHTPVPYVYNKRKSDREVHLLENIFTISKYPSKTIKNQVCILANANYKTVNVWFQNKRNCPITNKDESIHDKKINFFVKKHSSEIKSSASAGKNIQIAKPIDLCNALYREEGASQFIKGFPFFSKSDKKQMLKMIQSKQKSLKEIISSQLEKNDATEEDVLMYQLQEGIILRTKLNKEKYGLIDDKKLNFSISTDYLLAVMFINMSIADKKLFLKLRRRIAETE
ncbi:hypothetical protein EHP00_1755 [Ecytonucleospora hepatopenaei]|uniref:Homeobox domain-containing protein n=1 Tax=Ecytonucleospora hepatopenaei TaxID=646526 RepID=A0A1W0E4J2_9MICR|nr:hypothetical protein EHP00_1755 [Ecytonucleospora hepatopenaei]